MTTPHRSRWSTKQYILAALLGMLATVAIAASVSISLAPAHMALFVRDAKITSATYLDSISHKNLTHWYYNLTLEANNTSNRTAVSYGYLTVDIWESETAWIPTEEVNTSAALRGWLPPGSTALVKVGIERGQHNEETKPAANGATPPPPQASSSNVAVDNSSSVVFAKWPDCRVVVEAKVRFKFAGVPTLPYTVKVSCFPVNFLDGTRGPVNCTG